jgi:hypothetical protein
MTNTILMLVINAMIMVESGGNTSAEGDYRNGQPMAIGCLQIWPAVVEDVNRISRREYSVNDRYDRTKSVEMAVIYLSHYCSERRLGRHATPEDYAKCWNGGPNYFRKSASVSKRLDNYWSKVQSHM